MRQSNNQTGSSESRRGHWQKPDNTPNSEERALQRFAQMMIEKISSFQGDWKKPWFTEGALTWPKNLSGREYNGLNAMMLMMHCEKEGFKLPVFCTFDRVTSLNYGKDKEGGRVAAADAQGNELPRVSVNKGSKSIPVFITTFTCVDKETKEKIKYDDYKRLSAEEQKGYNVYPKLSVYNVFNVDQTNIKEARPELYRKLEEQNQLVRPEVKEGEMYSFKPVDHMIEHNEWICPIKPTHGDNAYYSISKNEIVIPEKSQFKDGESFLGNLYHEMSHSTGAEGVLNRLKPSAFGSKEYGIEELTAEMTAALVCQRYGMTKHLKEDSVAYLKGWLDTLKEEPTFIKTVLNDVKKSSSMIIDRIETVKRDMEVKLDVREDETQTVAINESGDAQLVEGESLGADRKQGDNEENSEEEEEEKEEETKRVARSLGRGR